MAISTYLLDDHAAAMDGLRTLLEVAHDIAVIGQATDGRTALKEIGKLLPDVVIMDVEMPEMNGIEATEQIRDKYPSVRTLIFSTHSSPEIVVRALRAGARGYVCQASPGHEVIDAVRTVHAGQRYLTRDVAEIVIDAIVGERSALSPRESAILELISKGLSNKQIARQLSITPETVKTHMKHVFAKLDVERRAQAVSKAKSLGLITAL
jgi:DNA-binding NarL/FixJ family response regulator